MSGLRRQNPFSPVNGLTKPSTWPSGAVAKPTELGMLTFFIGLVLGACIGVAAMGICNASYEHSPTE